MSSPVETARMADTPGWILDYKGYWKLLVAIVLPLALAYLFTSASSSTICLNQARVRPPRVPYWIPGVGNTLGFAFNTDKFLASIIRKFGKVPISMSIGAEEMYFIPHGPPILDLFKKSKQLTTKSLQIMTVRDAFGTPQADVDIFGRDGSGTELKPAPGYEHLSAAERFDFTQHRDLHVLLNGTSLTKMTNKFIETYSRRIGEDEQFDYETWTEVPDLYAVLRDHLLRSALEALCGDHFLELSPDFPAEFWEFDSHLPNLFKRLPRWLVPASHRARDKALEGVLRYHEFGRSKIDFTEKQDDWTSLFGAQLMAARQKMFANAGISRRGGAALDLGMIWAVNANAIPAAMWMLLGILQDDNLRARVMDEARPAFHQGSLHFDINKLCSGKLLSSIYLETLRIRVAAPVGRTSLAPDLRLGDFHVKKGVTMLSTSWVGGRDQDFWNTGRSLSDGSVEHPIDSFWAERFLRYEDDPASGPIKEKTLPNKGHARPLKRTSEDDSNASLVTEGMQAYWYPYGGGSKMCPGRFFAKQELMAGVAVFLRAYEVQLVDPAAAAQVRPNMAYFPFGTIPPKEKVAVRIRRREL